MANPTFHLELEQFREYLQSNENEDAKRPLLYPLFGKLNKATFKIESAACGADVYLEGQLLVESKKDATQWLEAFYQALHYHKKFGLAYHSIMIVAHGFCAIWKLNKLPEYAVIMAKTADPNKPPNIIGKENARKTVTAERQYIKDAAFYWLEPKDLQNDYFSGGKSLTIETHQILKVLRNLESDRVQINKQNFINVIEQLKKYFETPIEAVHAFYTMVAYWDITSTVSQSDAGEVRLVGFSGQRFSEPINVIPRHSRDFKKFADSQYIFTNEGSGLTVDYYFSRFDEVLAKIDPEYVKQHGIFFTDANLSRFALWFAKEHFPGNIDEDYIVFDPGGGSGNLVSSWRGKLKHKIVSELQPDLLKIIERRMKADPFHVEKGFTIVPKTSDNEGLNFLDRSAAEYLAAIRNELQLKNVKLDKPIAFLLNPPYKNTDENIKARENTQASYHLHPSILEITGEDAARERYLAFLGQILNIAKEQEKENEKLKPMVMIFTPTSWLIPRPTYVKFRQEWDKYFKYHNGFIVTSNEWFKIQGKWPLSFTMWIYEHNEEGHDNSALIYDLSHLKKIDLDKDWLSGDAELKKELNKIIDQAKVVKLDNSRGEIKTILPVLPRNGVLIRQTRYDYSSAKKKSDYVKLVSGFPLKNNSRHFELKRKCGEPDGEFIGFMDDTTPVRIKQDPLERLSNLPDRIWFRLDTTFKDINKSKCFNGPTDNRSYCAYDLPSAQATFTWFAITKALNGVYPLWANQYDIWPPQIKAEFADYWYALCFAFVLAENRCVVTKFEKDNPVPGAPEIFVDNPMCPANSQSFWNTTLDAQIIDKPPIAKHLVEKIKELYQYWNFNYCKSQFIDSVGLQDEPYFKYFDYADFLTPHSGLIQIRKYAEINGKSD